ncbi:MAG: L-dopachrome tautomerase-related protein [Planctomycetota bacterium]|jgi:sugar lactone lactonase YvrE
MRTIALAILPLFLALTSCGGKAEEGAVVLELVAESPRQWTGVAVAPDGRLFVNFPRWSDDVPVSVAELVDGVPVPYPDERWNGWTPEKDPGGNFVCVQSVTVDDEGFLWILDPANPGFAGVVEGGPKLLKIDLATNEVVETFRFGPEVAPPTSYLNDMRIDTGREVVYLSESGAGALVVLDANSGTSRRLLADHPSVRAEPIDIVIEGSAWKRDGRTPQVHADGIALSPDREWVYYQALTGRTLYRVPTAALRDATLDAEALAAHVERVVESGVSDAIAFGRDGHLYLTSLEESAINRVTPAFARELVVRDDRLAWPDSFAVGTDGWIYVTTAQIHRGPNPADPYRLWRFRP